MPELVIIGAGKYAAIAHEYFASSSNYTVRAFAVEESYLDADEFRDLPLVSIEDLASRFPPESHAVYVAISFTDLNRVRTRLLDRIIAAGYRPASFISPHAFVAESARLGRHCFVFESNVIQTDVDVGDNAILWSGNHIGHHSVIEDNVFISSHVVVAGSCRIGANTFIGVNAAIGDDVTVGDSCWIGPGAVITSDVKPRQIIRAPKPDASPVDTYRFFRLDD